MCSIVTIVNTIVCLKVAECISRKWAQQILTMWGDGCITLFYKIYIYQILKKSLAHLIHFIALSSIFLCLLKKFYLKHLTCPLCIFGYRPNPIDQCHLLKSLMYSY